MSEYSEYTLGNESPMKLEDSERQPCEVWTRVMGYFRPVEAFNIGKKQEYAERVCLSEGRECVYE